VADDVVPSAYATVIASAPATTWRAVRMVPSAFTITPVPIAASTFRPSPAASIRTTEGNRAR
jgi:hypothetical protein